MTSTTGVKIPPPVHNSLKLKALDPASQAGRITFPGQTRGQKADRLQLVAKLAPVKGTSAATFNWSATSVVVDGGRAYVTWHSDRQAATQATAWGGAIDVMDIPTEGQPWALNMTAQNDSMKLNQGYIANGRLYLAMTGSKVGASVGSIRLPLGDGSTMRWINLPGSSANSMQFSGSDLVAVTGYDGGAYRFNANFDQEERIGQVPVTNIASGDQFPSWQGESVNNNNYGGKFVTGGYILRTDANNGAIVPVNNPAGAMALDVPLTSDDKYAEAYDPSTGEWYQPSGEQAQVYGKHTMAVENGFAYVAAGRNGLHVYNLNANAAPVWSNGTSTTAVVSEGEYIYAATGIGLRVYKKNADGTLALYAYEVDKYKDDGTADSSTAASNGHSANFVALGGGYIFVAYGQTGVNIYKLNHDVPSKNIPVSLVIEEINSTQTGEIDPDTEESKKFVIPQDRPTPPEGKEFEGWAPTKDAEEAMYQPGDEVTVTPEHPDVKLYPVYKDKEQYTIEYNANGGSGSIESSVVTAGNTTTLPDGAGLTAPEGKYFNGWNTKNDGSGTPYTAGQEITPEGSMTLYAVWTEYSHKISFEGNPMTDAPAPSNMPGVIYTNDASVAMPEGEPTCGNLHFCGWSKNKDLDPAINNNWKNEVYRNKADFTKNYTFGENEKEVTLYAIWSTQVMGGDNPGFEEGED